MSKPATILNGEILLNVVAAGGRPAATRSLWTKVLLTTRGASFCVRTGPIALGQLVLGVLHWIYRTGPA
jgi:hypothetical protein